MIMAARICSLLLLLLTGVKAVTLTLKITNIAYSQPFSGFFYMVHNKAAMRLYRFGRKARDELRELAENGNPEELVTLFSGTDGVKVAQVVTTDIGPLTPGQSLEIDYEVDSEFPMVTLASMFVNSNDGIVTLDRVRPKVGDTFYSFGIDAGTEINNELCTSIPGPACSDVPGNTEDGNGEGYVHTHRGVHGIGDIEDSSQDWRNPMMKVEVLEKVSTR